MVARPPGVTAEDWRYFLALLYDYRSATSGGGTNEAAQSVAEEAVRLFLTAPGPHHHNATCGCHDRAQATAEWLPTVGQLRDGDPAMTGPRKPRQPRTGKPRPNTGTAADTTREEPQTDD